MALLSGFDEVNSANNTFSDWLAKTNAMIVLMRDDVITANSTIANTQGDAQLIGFFSANVVAANTMRGGDLTGGSANLTITSNAIFTSNVTFDNSVFVYVTSDIMVEGAAYPQANDVPLGNSTLRWVISATDVNASGNVDASVAMSAPLVNVSNTLDTAILLFDSANGNDIEANTANLDFIRVNTINDGVNEALTIAGNVSFTGQHSIFSGNVTINDTFIYVIDNTNFNDLIPNLPGRELGDSANTWDAWFGNTQIQTGGYLRPQANGGILGQVASRWAGWFVDIDASANIVAGNTVTTSNLNVSDTADIGTLTVTSSVDANTLTITGLANVGSLHTSTLSTSAGLLTVQPNTTFNSNVIMSANLTLSSANAFKYVITTSNLPTAVVPNSEGDDLGSTGTRWDVFAANVSVRTGVKPISNGAALGQNTARWDGWFTDGDFSGNIDVVGSGLFTGDVTADQLFANNIDVFQVSGTGGALNLVANDVIVSEALQVAKDLSVTWDVDANNFTGNTITANLIGSGITTSAGDLTVTPNTVFSSNVTISGNLTPSDTLIYVIDNTNFNDLIPNLPGRDLGNAANTWDAFLANTLVYGYCNPSANGKSLGSGTARWNLWAVNANVSQDLVANTGTFANLQITNTLTVNELDVTGNVDSVIVNALDIVANTLTIDTISDPDGELTVVSNTTFSGDLDVTGNLTAAGINYTINSNNYVNLPPKTTGNDLGTSSLRWDGFFANVNVSGYLHPTANGIACGNTTKRWDMYTTDIDASGDLVVGGGITGANLIISGTANIASLEVTSLTTETVALIGNTANVSTSAATVIDSFPATQSFGFKYFITSNNGNENAAYTLEILCTHTQGAAAPLLHFTRYGEIAVSSDITLVPDLNGGNVELTATCPSASGANVHNFTIMRQETRP